MWRFVLLGVHFPRPACLRGRCVAEIGFLFEWNVSVIWRELRVECIEDDLFATGSVEIGDRSGCKMEASEARSDGDGLYDGSVCGLMVWNLTCMDDESTLGSAVVAHVST